MELPSIELPWKPAHIVPVGDIQWAGDDEAVALSHLKEYLARALEWRKQGDTVLFLGMGDFVDFASPSNRARIESANLYDTALQVIDDAARGLASDLFAHVLRPTVDHWIGLLQGHHWKRFLTGETTDTYLSNLLKTRFLGDTACIRLVFKLASRGQRHHYIPFTLFAAHGCGNGQTGYYPVGRLEKVAADWEYIDVFLMGHTTKQAVEFRNRLRPRWNRKGRPDLSHRKVTLVGTGGFSKTYVEHAMQGNYAGGGYAEKRLLSPAILGSPIVHIRPRCLHGGFLALDYTVEG